MEHDSVLGYSSRLWAITHPYLWDLGLRWVEASSTDVPFSVCRTSDSSAM